MSWYRDVSPARLQRGGDPARRDEPCSALRRVALLHSDALRLKIAAWQQRHVMARSLYRGQFIDCIVKPGATNKDGYQQVNLGSVDGKQQTAYYHHVVMFAVNGDQGLPRTWHESVSHLCHHSDCVNPQHMVLEAHWKNVRRQACHDPDTCQCDQVHRCILPPNHD